MFGVATDAQPMLWTSPELRKVSNKALSALLSSDYIFSSFVGGGGVGFGGGGGKSIFRSAKGLPRCSHDSGSLWEDCCAFLDLRDMSVLQKAFVDYAAVTFDVLLH